MRFKKVLLTAFFDFNLSVFAGLAYADTIADHVITFKANVQDSCSILPSLSETGAFESITQTSSNFKINIVGNAANITTGRLTLGDVTCTSSNVKVTMTRNGWIKHKTNTQVSPIKYTAKVVDDGQAIETSVMSSANDTNSRIITVPGSSSKIGVDITTDPMSNLIAGDYKGTLNISISQIKCKKPLHQNGAEVIYICEGEK